MTDEEFKKQVLPLAGSLYKVAFCILESECDAEDAVQELFMKLWGLRAEMDRVLNVKAYCMMTMRNICLDMVRKHKNEEIVENFPETDSGLYADSRLRESESWKMVAKAIRQLPENQRKVLVMRTLENMTYAEIEQRTGMDYKTLRVLLSRARKTLKNQNL